MLSGTYTVTASALGYAPSSVGGVTLANGQTVTQNFSLYPVCTVFSDTVEAGNLGWSAQSPWAMTTESSHSATHSWTDSPGGNYGNNTNVALTSPILDLSGYSGVSLTFWQQYDFEATYDFGYVEYSTDGGSTWNGAAAYSGTQFGWVQVSFSLPALDNKANARLRFRLQSDVSSVRTGWHVDDIVLSGGGPGCVSASLPIAGFSASAPAVAGRPVSFNNLTSGSEPLSYLWNFGDSLGSSSLRDPSYSYANAGSYTVTLTATNPLGSDSAAHTVEVLPCVELTSASLAQSTPAPLYRGNPAQFSAGLLPAGATRPYTYTVSYGDGSAPLTAASSADPLALSHTYNVTGTYTLDFSAWSCSPAGAVSASLPVTVTARHGMTLLPAILSGSADPGRLIPTPCV